MGSEVVYNFTLPIKDIEWTWKFHLHGLAVAIASQINQASGDNKPSWWFSRQGVPNFKKGGKLIQVVIFCDHSTFLMVYTTYPHERSPSNGWASSHRASWSLLGCLVSAYWSLGRSVATQQTCLAAACSAIARRALQGIPDTHLIFTIVIKGYLCMEVISL